MKVSQRVLVAEDDDVVRGVIVRVLGERGYTVLQARNMPEAIEVARASGPVDLLLTDFHMPGGTGRELADALWQDNPELPVICMSGYNEDIPDDVDAPGVVHLPKPFKTASLLEQVMTLLRRLPGTPPPSAP